MNLTHFLHYYAAKKLYKHMGYPNQSRLFTIVGIINAIFIIGFYLLAGYQPSIGRVSLPAKEAAAAFVMWFIWMIPVSILFITYPRKPKASLFSIFIVLFIGGFTAIGGGITCGVSTCGLIPLAAIAYQFIAVILMMIIMYFLPAETSA